MPLSEVGDDRPMLGHPAAGFVELAAHRPQMGQSGERLRLRAPDAMRAVPGEVVFEVTNRVGCRRRVEDHGYADVDHDLRWATIVPGSPSALERPRQESSRARA